MQIRDREIHGRRNQQQNRPMPAARRKQMADDENIAAEQQAGDRNQRVAAFWIQCAGNQRKAEIVAQAAQQRQDNRHHSLRLNNRQKERHQADSQHNRAENQRPANNDADVPRRALIFRRQRLVQFPLNQAVVAPLLQFPQDNVVFSCHALFPCKTGARNLDFAVKSRFDAPAFHIVRLSSFVALFISYSSRNNS